MSDPVVETKVSDKPIGFLKDPAGDNSSKRLESFIALVYGMLMPVLAGILGWQIPVAEVVVSFLVYSAAMQGVAYFNERGMK